MPPRNSKHVAEGTRSLQKRAKTASGSASQPVLREESHPKLPIRTLPRKALIAAASQVTEDAPFESQLRDANQKLLYNRRPKAVRLLRRLQLRLSKAGIMVASIRSIRMISKALIGSVYRILRSRYVR
jgi:hypothetical protein